MDGLLGAATARSGDRTAPAGRDDPTVGVDRLSDRHVSPSSTTTRGRRGSPPPCSVVCGPLPTSMRPGYSRRRSSCSATSRRCGRRRSPGSWGPAWTTGGPSPSPATARTARPTRCSCIGRRGRLADVLRGDRGLGPLIAERPDLVTVVEVERDEPRRRHHDRPRRRARARPGGGDDRPSCTDPPAGEPRHVARGAEAVWAARVRANARAVGTLPRDAGGRRLLRTCRRRLRHGPASGR